MKEKYFFSRASLPPTQTEQSMANPSDLAIFYPAQPQPSQPSVDWYGYLCTRTRTRWLSMSGLNVFLVSVNVNNLVITRPPGPASSGQKQFINILIQPSPGRRYKTTIDFKWEPFIMSVINDVPPSVSTRRRQGLAIHLFVGQETVISLERQEESWSPQCHISQHKKL